MGETSSCSTSISTTNILKSGTWWVLFCSKDGRLLLFTRGVSNPTCAFFWRWKTRLPAFLGFFQGTTREVLMYWCCKFYEDITTWESHRSWLQQFLGLAWPFGQVRKGMLYGITFPWTGGRRVGLSKRLLIAADLFWPFWLLSSSFDLLFDPIWTPGSFEFFLRQEVLLSTGSFGNKSRIYMYIDIDTYIINYVCIHIYIYVYIFTYT